MRDSEPNNRENQAGPIQETENSEAGESQLDVDRDVSDKESNPLGQILGGATWVLVGRVIKLAGTFFVQIIVARVLGTSSFGGLSLAKRVTSIGSLVGNLGINRGVVRNVPYYEDDPQKYRGTVRAALWVGSISGFVVASTIILAAPWIADTVFNDPSITKLLRLSAIGIPVGIVGGIAISTTKGARDASTHTIVRQVVRPILQSLLVAGLVLLGYGAIGAIVGQVLTSFVSTILAIFLMIRIIPVSIWGESKRMYFKLLSFSLPLFLSSGMSFIVGSADTILLGFFRASSEVGVYSAAFTLRTIPLLFFFPATFLLSPVLTRLQKNEQSKKVKKTYKAISKWTTVVSLPLFLLGFLFPGLVLNLAFGSDYLSGTAAFRVIMLSAFGTLLFGANDRAIIGLGHNQASMVVTAGAGGLNVVLNLILIPIFGIIGAALASTIAFVARNMANTALLYKWHGLNPFSSGLMQVLALVATIVPAGYFLFTLSIPTTFLTVLAVGILFLLFYIPIVIRFGMFEDIDYEFIKQIEDKQGWDLSSFVSLLERVSGN